MKKTKLTEFQRTGIGAKLAEHYAKTLGKCNRKDLLNVVIEERFSFLIHVLTDAQLLSALDNLERVEAGAR